MSVHYFHCTDGADLIVDRRGRKVSDRRRVGAVARRVAGRVRAAVPNFHEWDRWAVYVYDEFGEVEIVPFPSGRGDRASAGTDAP